MKKIIEDFRSEKGAASVLEATIVFPLVFLVVIFLIFLGLTYAQQSFCNTTRQDCRAILRKR